MSETKQPLTPAQEIAALKKQLEAANQESAAKDAIINGQAEKLDAAEAQAQEGRPVITHESKQYRVLAPEFDVEGETVKAADLKDNKELVAKLLKLKSGVLQLVEKEATK